jgi:hypothetical protein
MGQYWKMKNGCEIALQKLAEAIKEAVNVIKELGNIFLPKETLLLSNRHNIYGHNMRMWQRRREKRCFRK